jgi:hypothetical protein
LVLLLIATPAFAQEYHYLSDNAAADTVKTYFMEDVAGNRKQPEFDPIPIRIGNFSFHPQIQANLNWDGNWVNRADTVDVESSAILAVPILKSLYGHQLPAALFQNIRAGNINPDLARVSDGEVDLDPALSSKVEWDRVFLALDATARFYHFFHLARENHQEWHAAATLQIALGEKSDFTLAAGADSRAEAPGANGTAVLNYYGFGPSIHTNPAVSATAHFPVGPILAQLTGNASRDFYSTLVLRTSDLFDTVATGSNPLPPSLTVSQADRADQVAQLMGSITYRITSETQLFIQTSYQHVKQLHPPRDQTGNAIHPFDSDTFGFLVGAAVSINGVIVIQAGGGWQYHHYDDPFYQNTSRLNLQGAADWYPTRLLSFRVTLGQNYTGSAIAGVGDTSVRTMTVRADYEFRRNIEVWALWSTEWDQFPAAAGITTASASSGAKQAMQSGNFEVDYRPNRLLTIGINIGVHDRLSDDTLVLGPFRALRGGLTITLRH